MVSAPVSAPDGAYTATWDWGDGSKSSTSVATSGGLGPAEATHTYTSAGIYTITLRLTGNEFEDRITSGYVVIHPAEGHATGGGWIDSPEGACKDTSLCVDAAGKANFGFVSEYQKGASIPTGQTEFQFNAGNLSFHSSTYEWLLVNQAGTNAQLKGWGKVNGQSSPNGDYKFMLWAADGEPDTLRIKIWWEDGTGEHPVYDNGATSRLAAARSWFADSAGHGLARPIVAHASEAQHRRGQAWPRGL